MVKAVSMHSVTASQKSSSLHRGVHVFKTNCAVLFELALFARVRSLLTDVQTTLALFTVEVALFWSDSANSATIAVEDLLSFPFVIKQVAHGAKVNSKLDAALFTILL